MKKVLFILIPIVAIAAIYSFTVLKPKKEVSDYFKSLKEYGFGNTPEIGGKYYGSLRDRFKKETGLDFISDEEMIQLTNGNNMVWSQAANYKSSLPKEAGIQIIKSYSHLKNTKHYYNTGNWEEWKEVGTGLFDSGDKGVFVVSYPDMFKDGAPLHSGRDPIAVVKVDGGWLELARWK